MDTDRLTLAALLAGVLARWRDAVSVAVGVVALALLLAIVLPPRYESNASFVTTDAGVQLPKGLADLTSQPGVSGLASQLGLGGGTDPSTSPAFYWQLLQSRELLTRLVLSRYQDPRSDVAGDSADLLAIYRIRQKDRQRAIELGIKRVKRDMTIGYDARTNYVTLTVSSRWPVVAAAVANRAVELVSQFNREQRLSRARARRIFLEGRVADAQNDVKTAEATLRDFYEQNRLWQSSPGLVVAERDVRRQVDVASDLYLTIRREFEEARLDEVNTTPVITVVDPAVAARKPQWPQYAAVVVTAALLGAVLGLLWAAARVVARHWALQHPADAALMREAAHRMVSEVRWMLRRRRAGGAPMA